MVAGVGDGGRRHDPGHPAEAAAGPGVPVPGHCRQQGGQVGARPSLQAQAGKGDRL